MAEENQNFDIEKPHSIEIKMNAKKELAFTVKAYGKDATETMETVTTLFNWLSKELPEKMELGVTNLKVRGDTAEEIIKKSA